MMTTVKDLLMSRFFKIWVIIVLLLAIGAIVFEIWAHDAIDSAYDASVAGKPTVSFIDHERHTRDHYHDRADLIFWQYLFCGIPLTLLLWYLLIRGVMYLIRQSREAPVRLPLPQYEFKGDSVVALLIYVTLTLFYFAPLLGSFGTHLLGPPEDNMGGFWSQWWAVEQVLRGDASLNFTRHLFYPEGVSLYYHGWSFYSQIVAAIVRLFLNPTATYNFVVLHSYPIAGIGAFLLVKRFTGNSIAALTGGFLFAFAPAHFMRSLHHVNQSAIQFVPFFVLYFISAAKSGSLKSILLTGLFLLLNTLCDWNFLIMAGYFILFGYLYFMLKQRSWWLGSYIARSGVILACAIVPLLPWLIPMLKIGLQYPGADLGGRNTWVVDLMGLFIPHAGHLTSDFQPITAANQSYTGNAWECVGYLGLGAISLILLNARELVRIGARYWLGFLSFLTLALGPQIHLFGASLPIGLPYTVVAFIPFLRSARAPGRFMIYVYLFWAVLVAAALLLSWARSRSSKRKLALCVISAILVLDFFSLANQSTRVPLTDPLRQFADKENPQAILNLPQSYIRTRTYMAQQTYHGIPMVGGAPTRKLGEKLIDRLEFKDLKEQQHQLAEAGVTHILIHKYSLVNEPVQKQIDTAQYILQYSLVHSSDSLLILSVR